MARARWRWVVLGGLFSGCALRLPFNDGNDAALQDEHTAHGAGDADLLPGDGESDTGFAPTDPSGNGDATLPGLPMVSDGWFHSCGLRADGTAVCWGAGTTVGPCDGAMNYGQAMPPSGAFVSIAAGMDFTCAVRPSHRVECWGKECLPMYLSIGSLRAAVLPPEVEISQISTYFEGDFACSLTTAREIRCWGNPADGQLLSPTGQFVAVAAGAAHACALREDGSVACWGLNYFGEATSQVGPFRRIAVGSSCTCALDFEGFMWRWGGATGGVADPTPRVNAGQRFEEVPFAFNVCAGLSADGGIFLPTGEWGDGTWEKWDAPPLRQFAGRCGITVDNHVWCTPGNFIRGENVPPEGFP